jgi:chromatin assembly factor 1 subunit A
LHKKSNLLSCRNPFRADENIINYEMDTEDEWAEENGESLREDGANKSDEEDEEFDDEEDQQGFIVDDDYLSVSEMNYSNMELN